MTGPALSVTRTDGIATVVFDLPGESVNKITKAVRNEFSALLDDLAADTTIRAAILLSGKPDNFIAGADIDEFVALRTREEAEHLVRDGQALVNRFGQIGKPFVVAIHGACVGGGFETALACAYRIATDHPKTVLGLPEVQIGIIPAAGGCQRLPRLIGIRAALDIILAGKTIPANRAYRLGMADELVHPAILERVALDAAQRLASGWRPKRKSRGVLGTLIEGNPLGRAVVFSAARKQVLKKTGGHYPAPLAALQTVELGIKHGIPAGLDCEASWFAELAVGAVSRKLVQIFFATTALRKDSGVAGNAPPPRPVNNLVVVGAGFMGAAIAGVGVTQAEADVRLRDTDLARVGQGVRAARKQVQERRDRKRITGPEYRRLVQLVSGGTDWAGAGRADLVIEAVFEDLEVKRQVFQDLETQVTDACVLASNTSTIPIERIAASTRRPERVIGMHFFSPVDRMPLLEVIVTPATAPWATVTAVAFGRRMGKTVVVVQDRPGFWVNRILAPYLNEAGRMLAEGVPAETLDRAMIGFGFPVGPITLLDEVGLDVVQKASNVLYEAFGDRMRMVDTFRTMVEHGRLGRKSGQGFYQYTGGRRSGVAQSVDVTGPPSIVTPSQQEVEQRMVYAMVNEAAFAFDEGVVRSARDGDIAAVFGIGYPAFRGGPLRYLDDVGAERAVEILDQLRDRFGDRFTPAPLLVRMSQLGGRFHPH